MGDTEGERLFLIRAALGRGIRKPMPQRDFAELLAQQRGRSYDASKISMIEQGKQRMSIDDAEDFAAVDPEKRGAPWVVFGIVATKGTTTPPAPPLTNDPQHLPPEVEPEEPGPRVVAPNERTG